MLDLVVTARAGAGAEAGSGACSESGEDESLANVPPPRLARGRIHVPGAAANTDQPLPYPQRRILQVLEPP